jgi:hypothetical protein
MTPLARRASLLVGFSLLASAATAHAEGAWVLWTRASESQDQLNQMASYQSRQDCLNSAKEVAMRPGTIKGVDVKNLADVKDTKTFTGVTILETPKGWSSNGGIEGHEGTSRR